MFAGPATEVTCSLVLRAYSALHPSYPKPQSTVSGSLSIAFRQAPLAGDKLQIVICQRSFGGRDQPTPARRICKG